MSRSDELVVHDSQVHAGDQVCVTQADFQSIVPQRMLMTRRRVLIVSPHFPPVNAADCHRVRVLIPYLRDFGWEPEVLALESSCVAAPQDDWLAAGIPEDISVHRISGLGLRWSRFPGLGGIGMRSYQALKRKGSEILGGKQFDLIYFSTTVFSIHALGPYWKTWYAVPFVIDYQDPWVTDYYFRRPNIRPPGGWLKYRIVDAMARWQEPRVLQQCAGMTEVSRAYGVEIRARYPRMKLLPELVLPFPGSKRDFVRATQEQVTQHCFRRGDGKQHWVYVGVSGPMMEFSLSAFFAALAAHIERNPEFRQQVELHFIGTSYAPSGTAEPVVKPIAAKFGLDDLVFEQTDRIPFSQALRCLIDADVLLVPGSDDPTYNASKLFPYLLARKPMLAVFHEDSPVPPLIQRVGGATLVTFQQSDEQSGLTKRIEEGWFAHQQFRQLVDLDETEMQEFTDEGQAQRLCEFFEMVLDSPSGSATQ